MSLAETCLWTLARTVALCLLAWPVAHALERLLRSASDATRPWLLAGVLAPFCFPELLVGYAFRDFAMARPEWAEVLCSGLLFVRIVPVGACALLAAPHRDRDSAAIHCRWLLVRAGRSTRRDWFELARCYWHGPIARALPALALMSLIAFQEFETAALLQTMSWTDWFVAAQRVGLNRTEMLGKSLWPMLLQLPVLLAVMRWLGRASDLNSPLKKGGRGSCRAVCVKKVPSLSWLSRSFALPSMPFQQAINGGVTSLDHADSELPSRRTMTRFAILYIAIAGIAGCLIPLGLIGWRAVDGFGLLLRQRSQQLGLAREIVTAGCVALCAGIAAWTLSGRTSRASLGGLLLPGLFGSLLLSLCVVEMFQQSWLRPLYDTPLPWLLALTLWLLPRAAILRLWLQITRRNEAVHLAEMLEGARDEGRGTREKKTRRVVLYPSSPALRPSSLIWRLRDEPRFLAASLLCFWAYCDLPTAFLLAPSGMASGLVRLYNFMHFGRSPALSVEACLFFGAPIICVSLVLAVVRWWRAPVRRL